MSGREEKGRDKHGEQHIVLSIDFGCNPFATFNDCDLEDKGLEDRGQYQSHDNHEEDTMIFQDVGEILSDKPDKLMCQHHPEESDQEP